MDFYDFSEEDIFILNMEEASHLVTQVDQLDRKEQARLMDLCNLCDDILLFCNSTVKDDGYMRSTIMDVFFDQKPREIHVERIIRIWRRIYRKVDRLFQRAASQA
ncbi:hypothetical protein GCM10008938_35010 [Deinococcus roseus]|uniref:Uncharacterized protein n=1 Tax=Deinococcus roseus TaxID=392414 RepID=A0ABQ2D4F1_9DEIO|nr:hypothetical protein GCM10008938_35010 [Deinococcus roseus]